MFDKLFICIGNIVLLLYSLIINFKLPKLKSRNSEVNVDILKNKSEDTFLERLRAKFMERFLSKRIMVVWLLFASILLVFTGIEISGIFIVCVGMIYVFMIKYPQIRQQRSYNDLSFELPYALRHMGVELKSGKGLHDTLITVANEDYGSFSRELTRALEEVRYGKSTENALLEMSSRVNSDGLSRCVQQIVGTLRVGGNLAHNLEIIADDISFDMHIKLKDYSQRLNAFILIYTFVAILAPVILLIMLMAASTVMGDIVSSEVVMLMYGGLFPMIVVFMGAFIKKLEPKI